MMYIIVKINAEKNLRNPWNHIVDVAASLAQARKIAAATGLHYVHVPDAVFDDALMQRFLRESCPEKSLCY